MFPLHHLGSTAASRVMATGTFAVITAILYPVLTADEELQVPCPHVCPIPPPMHAPYPPVLTADVVMATARDVDRAGPSDAASNLQKWG